MWDAVRDHPGDVVIDTSVLSAQNGTPPLVSGIDPNDATFPPFQLDISSPQEGTATSVPTWRVTVIGFMTRPIWDGVYLSTRTALADGIFRPPAPAGSPAGASPTAAVPSLTPTGYYFSVRPGADVNRARLDLGRLLVRDQLEPVSVADQQAQSNGALVTLLNLLTGFLALGLVVGIAGLGVISTRAVVERRQQIGMMRAIGYRRSHVQRSFLMESGFIAILGLVTTYLPARAAARVPPAEALRFE